MRKEDERQLITFDAINSVIKSNAVGTIVDAAVYTFIALVVCGLAAWACSMSKTAANPFMMNLFLLLLILCALLLVVFAMLWIVHAAHEWRRVSDCDYRIVVDVVKGVNEDEPVKLDLFERNVRRLGVRHRKYFEKAYYFENFGRAIYNKSHIVGVGIAGHPYYLVVSNKNDEILCAYDATTHRLPNME